MRSKILKGSIVFGLSMMCLTGCAFNVTIPDTVKVESIESNDSVCVSATAELTVVPDKATISIGTESQDMSAEKAQEQHTEKVNAIIEEIKTLGVEESNIQTTNYSLYDDYKYTNGSRVFAGYVVSCDIKITGIDIDNLGEYITKSIQAGATEVSRIQYECTKYDEVYEAALKEAIADAKHKAQLIAEASGRNLGKATYANEGYQNTQYRYVEDYSSYDGLVTNSLKATAEESFVDVMPGEIEVSAEVEMIFEMK